MARAEAVRHTATTTSASATETWATGVCTSITTWQAALKSAAGSLKSNPTKNGLQTAGNDAKAATQTLASDLKGLGKPDTQAGQQAKNSLDQLSTSLQQDVATIESAVKGASGLSGALKAVPTVTATLATMETQVKNDGHEPPRARREGRTEDCVRELERLQLPEERLMNRTSFRRQCAQRDEQRGRSTAATGSSS